MTESDIPPNEITRFNNNTRNSFTDPYDTVRAELIFPVILQSLFERHAGNKSRELQLANHILRTCDVSDM